MTAEEFRTALQSRSVEELVEELILVEHPGPYLSDDAMAYFSDAARDAFQIDATNSLKLFVVGSAKLGFAALEKHARKGKIGKPAYREFEPGVSDIDIAVVSPLLYGKLWQELARYGSYMANFPWRCDLSNYMLSGWIRPDKFPSDAPNLCRQWNSLVNRVSTSKYFKYKNLRCGIYQSRYFLSVYQQRGFRMARDQETLIQ